MKFKFICSSRARNSVTKKFISSSLAAGLLFHTTLSSLASTLSEDGRYETFEGNNIAIDNVLEEDTVNVEIEGNTMVNVTNQKGLLPVTKSYTVEGANNHIPLQGNYNGKARPVIEGNTMYYNNDTGELSDTFVEGANLSLKSSFEDQLVTQEMVNSGQEKAENLGKYKVEYKITGKNKFNASTVMNGYELAGPSLSVIPSSEWFVTDYIRVSPNTRYSVSGKKNGNVVIFYDINKNPIKSVETGTVSFTTADDVYYVRLNGYLSQKSTFQLEEGSIATEYEPYKESIKTFYLNSPLLEGDTIEDVNGKATHVKRYGKIVLDGDENFSTNYPYDTYGYTIISSPKDGGVVFCDNFISNGLLEEDSIGMGSIGIGITYSDKIPNLSSLIQYLQVNPTTVVYELASPIYETISQDLILCDSYVGGHLDLNSKVPINKASFRGTGMYVNYLNENTQYTVQFKSDNVGHLDYFVIADINSVSNIPISRGTNKISISTTTSTVPYIFFNGIGFNISNIQVVATNDDFGYFEGMQSSFENAIQKDGFYNVDIIPANNLFKRYNLEKGGYTWAGGNYTSTTTNKCVTTNFIPVVSGKTLYRNKRSCIFLYDENYNYLGNTQVGHKETGIYSEDNYVIEEGVHYIHIEFEDTYGSDSTSSVFDDAIFSYKPIEQHLNKTKISLSEPLRSLPSGIKDRIIKRNGQWTVERNIGEFTLSNADDLKEVYADGEDYTQFNIGFNKHSLNNWECITEDFLNVRFTNTVNSEAIAVHHQNLLVLKLKNSKATNKEELDAWLKNNPITGIYQLATPVYEPLNIDPIVNLYLDTTYISNNSNIPANMKVVVDRAINRAVEAIELARTNPTMENVSIARMWANLIKESSKKDELQGTIDSFTEIKDLSIEKKVASVNADVYIKMKNSLSLSLDTNSIVFDDFDTTEGVEIQNAVNLTVSSSLPYRVNAYLEDELYNADKSKKLDKSILNIKSNKSAEYRGFLDIDTPIILLDDQEAGTDTIHGVDVKLNSTDTHKADVYKTAIKFEVEQK